MRAFDPRAVANLLLDEADQRDMTATNLALQKLLCLAQGIYLTQNKKPLVSGCFEAWRYGAVHPAVHRAFKDAGSSRTGMRAQAQDPLTGRARDLPTPTDPEVVDLVRHVLVSYGRMSPGRLVGFVESFNGRMRDELLDETMVRDPAHARVTIAARAADPHTERPHPALDDQTPATRGP